MSPSTVHILSVFLSLVFIDAFSLSLPTNKFCPTSSPPNGLCENGSSENPQ